MKRTRTEFLSRAAGELLIIVVGVLIAFRVDAWRETRENDSRAATQLEALQRDLRVDSIALDGLIEGQSGFVEAQKELIGIIHGSIPRPSSDSIGSLFFTSRRFHRFSPTRGAYDALVASGDLRLVGDTELRNELAFYYDLAGSGWEDDELSTLYRAEYTSALANYHDFLASMPTELKRNLELPNSSSPVPVDRMLSDTRVSAYLTMLVLVENGQLFHLQRLQSLAWHFLNDDLQSLGEAF